MCLQAACVYHVFYVYKLPAYLLPYLSTNKLTSSLLSYLSISCLLLSVLSVNMLSASLLSYLSISCLLFSCLF